MLTHPPRTYSGANLLQVAMPIGGIGAGCVCLNGHGGLQDFSIYNRPATTAGADGHHLCEAAFALLHIKGEKPITRLVEGPLPVEKIYDQGLQAQGYRKGAFEGLPRFSHSSFSGSYPFGTVALRDDKIPLTVEVTGWNPFIPLDDVHSGIPCAVLEYTLENPGDEPVEFEFSYHLSHLAVGASGWPGTRNEIIAGAGIYFRNNEEPNHESFGSAALIALADEPVIKAMWLRGGWFDSVSALWRQVSEGRFAPNEAADQDLDGRNGGSILIAGTLSAGGRRTIPLAITWHFPNSNLTMGRTDGSCSSGCGCDGEEGQPAWRPFYVGQWRDAGEVASYLRTTYKDLRGRTKAFVDTLAASTLPEEVIDAVTSNLAILKSPTILRQENGQVWGWEGCFATVGCCAGTCTHVWNYAQALPHLFPHLERTLREQELRESMDERGHVDFRGALPAGPTRHVFHAASDGQLGGIMKLYRDWQISGDRTWMESLYPAAKRSLDFCIESWDPERQGALFEPHHNTYDIEFWGPDGMCSSIYVGALAAMAEMAADLGKADEAASYRELAEKGASFLDAELFNGEYFEQKVMWTGLRDTSFLRRLEKAEGMGAEERELLREEGPKYQYGSGCISDGVIGAWMARIYGIPTPQTAGNIRKNLASIVRYNFRGDLWEHANPQRPGYALGHEAGLLLCSWPRGGKPTLPFVYSDEVWTGIEYQVASHLIEEGMVDDGLKLVRAVRSRFDGRTRNPFNEYECGSYYARAMASYALLGSLSGFRYSAATRTLWFGPRLKMLPFRIFFSTAGGWGEIELSEQQVILRVVEGKLEVENVELTREGTTRLISWQATASPGNPASLALV